MRPHSINHRVCPQTVRRRGLTVLELTVASAVLAMLLATSMQMIRVVSERQRASERRSLALQTVQAISEEVGNTPWEQFTEAAAEQFAIPAAVAPHLPGAKLVVAVADEAEPAAKRVVIEITWNGPGGQRTGPVHLTSWIFPEQPPPVQ